MEENNGIPPKRGRKRIRTTEEVADRKRQLDRNRSAQRVVVGAEIGRWNRLRGERSHAEFAASLLDLFETQQDLIR